MITNKRSPMYWLGQRIFDHERNMANVFSRCSATHNSNNYERELDHNLSCACIIDWLVDWLNVLQLKICDNPAIITTSDSKLRQNQLQSESTKLQVDRCANSYRSHKDEQHTTNEQRHAHTNPPDEIHASDNPAEPCTTSSFVSHILFVYRSMLVFGGWTLWNASRVRL